MYYAIGRYISENSRSGYWGTGALEIISGLLKEDLPGLMGFGVSSLKNMRIFYEAWSIEVSKSPTMVGDLQVSDSEPIAIRQPQLANYETTRRGHPTLHYGPGRNATRVDYLTDAPPAQVGVCFLGAERHVASAALPPNVLHPAATMRKYGGRYTSFLQGGRTGRVNSADRV